MLSSSKVRPSPAWFFGFVYLVFSFSSALTADEARLPGPEQSTTSIFERPFDLPSTQVIPPPSPRPSVDQQAGSGNQNVSEPFSWSSTPTQFVLPQTPAPYPSDFTSPSEQYPAFDTAPSFNAANSFEQNEILSAGHTFFGTVTEGLAKGIEYLFQSQGKPNAYILGEDAGGALLVGLRYGEGMMHLKNAASEKVFWQGPTIGYDAGAEGSKTMILVYNLKDPTEIYDRFSGIQGTAYFIGGISIQLQKHDYVTLAILRSGLGLRLGANIGYLNYTRTPTWNPL